MIIQFWILFQMSTIDNIRFNSGIYQPATSWTLLLYQLNGTSVVIPVPNADVMFFIQVFDNLMQCEDWISRNSGKSITLFAYGQNLQEWLIKNSPVPNNIQGVKIFCHSDDQSYLTHWTNRYRHRYRHVLFEVIPMNNLNYALLSFGLDHIQRLRLEFQEEYGILNLLDCDCKRICQSLGDYALHRANIESERIRQSEEARS